MVLSRRLGDTISGEFSPGLLPTVKHVGRFTDETRGASDSEGDAVS